MNAVMKITEANNSTGLRTIEANNLMQFLELPESVQDSLYSEASQKLILDKIEFINQLVYQPTDEKQMLADATAINKFATAIDKTAAAIYKRETESSNFNRSISKGHVNVILDIRKQKIQQFEEVKQKRLDDIKAMMTKVLVENWDSLHVAEEFRLAVLPEPKESFLTAKGALTKAAYDCIYALSDQDKSWQREIESRTIAVELACLRADIKPPFSAVYIGPAFTSLNKSEFEERLNVLIEEDAKRKAEMESRIILAQEAKRQKEIQDALSKQVLVSRSQKEEVIKEKFKLQIEDAVSISVQHKNTSEKVLTRQSGMSKVELKGIFLSEYPLRYSDGELADGCNLRLAGIFEKALMAGILDDADKRFISAFKRFEVCRVS